MATILRRPAAERDLIEIYKYIAKDSPSRARDFIQRIDKKIKLLADHPLIGAAKLSAYPDIRAFPIGRYLILYQPLDGEDGIELIRVIHGAREWETLLEDDLP